MDRPTPCVIDVEASGFGRGSYPVEVGYVLPDGRARCMLVRPPPHWTHWDAGAERVHGITRETLARLGLPPAEVARRLNEELEGRTVYCDGWAHDFAWLAVLFHEAEMLQRFRLESVRQLLDEDALPRMPGLLVRAREHLGSDRHRASHDARVLQWALVRAVEAA